MGWDWRHRNTEYPPSTAEAKSRNGRNTEAAGTSHKMEIGGRKIIRVNVVERHGVVGIDGEDRIRLGLGTIFFCNVGGTKWRHGHQPFCAMRCSYYASCVSSSPIEVLRIERLKAVKEASTVQAGHYVRCERSTGWGANNGGRKLEEYGCSDDDHLVLCCF
jgi:hypothetical protein